MILPPSKAASTGCIPIEATFSCIFCATEFGIVSYIRFFLFVQFRVLNDGPDRASFWRVGVTLIALHGQRVVGDKTPAANPVAGLSACGG